MTCNLNKNIL